MPGRHAGAVACSRVRTAHAAASTHTCSYLQLNTAVLMCAILMNVNKYACVLLGCTVFFAL
eukprot:19778-Heterococcus_DN1.PRE.5